MKVFFTQCAALIVDRPVDLSELVPLLRSFGEILHLQGSDDWAVGGNGFLVPITNSERAFIAVDVVSRAWPDDMGDSR
jgi:hypothetical protein